MRAAILLEPGATPEVGDFDAPEAQDGQALVEVRLAGVNPVDIFMAAGAVGPPRTPSVVGREGIGVMEHGARVYFNESIAPYGSFAEQTVVDPGRTLTVPEELDDRLAVACGIAGQAAWLPLTYQAELAEGENVLVLGATGSVGRIAVQAAKILGAGRVVAAGRHPETLAEVAELGADATVTLGGEDDTEALRAEAGDGWNVVIDPVYGAPFLAALETSAPGARLVTIGGSAGVVPIPYRALQGRVHIGHGNRVVPWQVFHDGYAELAKHAAAGELDLAFDAYPLERSGEAWEAQAAGPHAKIVVETA